LLNSNVGEKGKASKNSLFSNLPKTKTNCSKLRNFNDDDDGEDSEVNSDNENKLNHDGGKISFKDLCDEDKLKIANLVKELAK
jgi:hypothetical protein